MATLPIRLKRGLKANLPKEAGPGEPLVATDTGELYIGQGTGKALIGPIGATVPATTSPANNGAGGLNLSDAVNLIRNAYRVQEAQNAGPRSQYNMYTDAFNDATGIDNVKSSNATTSNGQIQGFFAINDTLQGTALSPVLAAPYSGFGSWSETASGLVQSATGAVPSGSNRAQVALKQQISNNFDATVTFNTPISTNGDTGIFFGGAGIDKFYLVSVHQTDVTLYHNNTGAEGGPWTNWGSATGLSIAYPAKVRMKLVNNQFSMWINGNAILSNVALPSVSGLTFPSQFGFESVQTSQTFSNFSITDYGAPLAASVVTNTITAPIQPTKMVVDAEFAGAVTFDLSLDDGATYPLINVRLDYMLDVSSLVGTKIRVRSNIPAGGSLQTLGLMWYDNSSVITATGLDPALGSMILNDSINLLKSNFRSAESRNVGKYSWRNFVIDAFNDATGVDAAKSVNPLISGGRLSNKLKPFAKIIFNADGTAQDIYGNTTPSVKGAPAVVAGDQLAKALDFGNSTAKYVDLGTIPSALTGAPNFAVVARIKLNAGGTRQPLLDFGDSITNGAQTRAYIFVNASNVMAIDFSNAAGPAGVTNLNDGKWHTIGITYTPTGNAVNIYVDGVLEKSGTMASTLNATTGGIFRIATDGTNANNMQVQDVIVFAKVLDQATMQDLTGKNQTIATQEPFTAVTTVDVASTQPTKLVLDAEYTGTTPTFDVSLDDAVSWITNVALDQFIDVSSKAGSKIRVKATIPYNGEIQSLGYAWFDNSVALAQSAVDPGTRDEILTLKINLMKTNFRVAALQSASRYSMKNMIIDDFQDAKGIDAKSTAMIDLVNKRAKAGYTANIVPVMTSNTAPNGTVTVSSHYTGSNPVEDDDGWKAFNKTTYDPAANYVDNRWVATSPTAWIAYEFTAAKIVQKYTLVSSPSAGRIPKNWTFEGSNDGGTTYTVLHTVTNQTGWTSIEKRDFYFSNATAYKKYRLNVSANNGDAAYVELVGFQMMELLDPSDLISIPDTASVAPTKLILSVDETLNTGKINYQASRDGGTTWRDVVAETPVDLSTTPVGTQVVLKATIKGDATLNAWGYSWS